MSNIILERWSLGKFEKILEYRVSKCEFWGDLEFSYDELEVLKERLKAILSVDGVTINYLCKHYPHSVTTFMVFFVRYKYNINFWRVLGEELDVDIPVYIRPELGDCAKRMFSRYGMDISDTKDEMHQIIAPIIYEACLPPESSLDDLFYVMSYDTYKVFDPQLIIDDLIEMRSYKIRKPLYRFLSRFRDDRAVDFVLEVRDAMITAEQRNSRPSRYLGNYSEWKEKEKSRAVITNRKNQEFQTRPYLVFDNGNKGLCIILPRTILSSEWIDEVTWTITGTNGFCRKVYCRVFGDEGRRYIDTLTVAVSPSAHYKIHMDDTEGLDEKSSRDWEIDGVSDIGILYFNSNGRQTKSNYLLSPYGVMIIPENVSILKAEAVDISHQFYPNCSNKYRIVSLTPLSDNARFSYGSKDDSTILYVRPQFNLHLEGKTLFSTDPSYNIFTNIPLLHITTNGNILSDGIEIRIGSINYIVDLSSEEDNIYALSEMATTEIVQYGTYSVRLYQFGRFLKQIEFSYVPEIKTNYTSMIRWPWLNNRREKKTFKFEKLDEWEMEFENCIVTHDNECYMIEVPSSIGSVPMTLKSMQEEFIFRCEMELAVNPFEALIIDIDGNLIENITDRVYKTGIDWILENEMWLSFKTYGGFKERGFNVRLRTSNGIEQSENINLTQNGAGNLNLSIFNDTLRNCPLPAKIEIICDEDEEMSVPILLVTEILNMEKPVKYQVGESKSYIVLDVRDDGKDIDIVRFGFKRQDVYIPYSHSVLGKSGKTRGYLYPGILSEGIYTVTGNRKQAIFEFEENSGVELAPGNNVILVSCRKRNKKQITTTKEWLDLLMAETIYTDVNDSLANALALKILNDSEYFTQLEKIPLDDQDIEKLVALAYYVNGKIVNAKKDNLRKCMSFFSSKYLRRGDRYRIIELLVEIDTPQEVFDICLENYSLMLFYAEKRDAGELSSKVEKYSIELSVILSMSTDDSIRDCVWREKCRDLIGKEAIRKLLSVPEETDPVVIVNEQKKFLREISGSKIKIHLDDEIAGNEEAIQGMIVWDTKYPMLDIRKKPEYGIYFGRIKYVDQYVNWYKNTHDKKGNANPAKRKLMQEIVTGYADQIKKAFLILEKDAHLSVSSGQYVKALRARYRGESTAVSYPRFFYLQGLAAFLSRLPVYREDLDRIRVIGIQFMEAAFIIAPRLSIRDILMAETYRYLKRKEELLCR